MYGHTLPVDVSHQIAVSAVIGVRFSSFSLVPEFSRFLNSGSRALLGRSLLRRDSVVFARNAFDLGRELTDELELA